jgi:hypothetical protein
MNTNVLAKHYESLTPRERLPLILAAAARGDEQERQRLLRSAPRLACSVQDQDGLGRALYAVAAEHLLALLETIAWHGLCDGRALPAILGDGDAKRRLDVALLCVYLVQVRLAGWRQFCAEKQFPAELYWSLLPGSSAIQAFELIWQAPLSPEHVRACGRRLGDRDSAAVLTAEAVAAGLRKQFQVLLDWFTPK